MEAILSMLNVDVNFKNLTGFAPLHVAADLNRAEIAERLLKEDEIDINLKGGANKTSALHIAAEQDNIETCRQSDQI